MELVSTKNEKQSVKPDVPQLPEKAFEIIYYDGQPSFKFWLFLNQKPDVSIISLDNLIEKGVLNMGVKLSDPSMLSKNKNPGSRIRMSELELFDNKKQKIISKIVIEGPATVFSFHAILDNDDCRQLQNAMRDNPSSLHIGGTIWFIENDKEYGARFLFPLRNLLGERFYGLPLKIKNNCTGVKYFDPVKAGYIDAPVFSTSRSFKNRSVGIRQVKVIKHKNKLIQPGEFIKPQASTTFSLVSNPLATYHGKNKLWYLSNIKIKASGTTDISLPVITDDDGSSWYDSVDKKKIWYLPSYRIEYPSQTALPHQSPFLLTFKRIGADATGQPVLAGEVKITLQADVPEDARKKIKSVSGSRLHPVPFSNQSFLLELPFRDMEGHSKISSVSPSEIKDSNGKIELVFQLSNTWIRACYGVFSIEGFQDSKAGIKIYSGFAGLAKAEKGEVKLLSGAGFLKLPLIKNSSALKSPAFSIPKRALIFDDQEINFLDVPKQRGNVPKLMMNKAVLLSKPNTANILVAKAEHKLPAKVESGEQLVERSFARSQDLEVFLSCQDFGHCYVEEENDGSFKSVGCNEPYRLGEIKFRLYEEIIQLKSAYFSIHRSLQSPDRFLIQPARYRVTRFAPGKKDTEYKACLHLYGAIDENEGFQNSLCVLDMSLEPDIPHHIYHKLRKDLKNISAHTPVMVFPGEVMEEVKFDWSLPQGMQVSTLSLGRIIQLTVSLDIMEVLTLQAMLRNGSLNGRGIYTLPDKSEYSVDINPDTSHITGPWEWGPVESEMKNGQVFFKNKIEKNIQVVQVVQYDNEFNELNVVPADKNLKPGLSFSIPSGPDGFYVAECVVEPQPSDLDESWVFMDDISLQLIFTTNIDFTQHNITSIEIEARFEDGPSKTFTGKISIEEPVIEFETFLPLSKIGSERLTSYRFHVSGNASGEEFSDWQQWSIRERGSIINLTSDLLFHT